MKRSLGHDQVLHCRAGRHDSSPGIYFGDSSMVPLPPEDSETASLIELPETTTSVINSNNHQDVSDSPQDATNKRGRESQSSSSVTSTTAPATATTATFNSNLLKWGRYLLDTVGVVACLFLLAGARNFRWSGTQERIHTNNGDINDNNPSREVLGGDDAGAAVAQEEASKAPAVANAAAIAAAAAHVQSTALLVALDDDLEGNAALKIWSDFASSAQKSTTAATSGGDGGSGGGSVGSGWGWGWGRGHGGGRNEQEVGDSSPLLFPPVWIMTSDPEVDNAIREGMPHLLSFFVPSVLGDGVGGGGDDGDPTHQEELSSWSGVLDRFLSENPGVDVFGMFGEGAMPTAALLPSFMVSDSVSSDATSAPAADADAGANAKTDAAAGGCGSGGISSGGGCAIESVLWPVLSKSTPPTAVLSRARAWWKEDREEDGADTELSGSEGMVGDWMPDRFVAQVWCNRAMLMTATRREATGLGEPESIGGKGLKPFLNVVQRLVREPGAAGAVLVDGTKAVPSRYLYPPAAAAAEDSGERKQTRQGGQYAWLRRLGQDARDRQEQERQLQEERQQKHQQEQPPGDPATTATPAGPDDVVPPKRQTLPEVDFYIGALELALGFEVDNLPAGVSKNATAAERVVSTTDSGSGSGSGSGEGIPDSGDRGVDAGVWNIVRAPWPPEYILDTVAQSPFPPDGFGVGDDDRGSGSQQGLVVVTSVNCGYLDMAVNSLLSMRRAAGHVKMLFVATDEVSFDFLDALTPGRAVLFPHQGSERPHATKAGKWGDSIFKQQTHLRPDLLLPIMKQGYRVLWIDSDTVWLGNILPILPDPRENTTTAAAAEVALVMDGVNKCTCLMYLDSTPNAMRLIELWNQEIIDTGVFQDQIAIQRPLGQLVQDGLRLTILPAEVMPQGNQVFSDNFLKRDYELYRDKLLIVHNNWIVGHDPKRDRFRNADLWEVDDWKFPSCQRRRNLRLERGQRGRVERR